MGRESFEEIISVVSDRFFSVADKNGDYLVPCSFNFSNMKGFLYVPVKECVADVEQFLGKDFFV